MPSIGLVEQLFCSCTARWGLFACRVEPAGEGSGEVLGDAAQGLMGLMQQVPLHAGRRRAIGIWCSLSTHSRRPDKHWLHLARMLVD